MRRFLTRSSSAKSTNSPPRTPPSQIVGPVKQALTTIDPRVKGLGALVATAGTIASSIASPPRDLTDTSSDEPGSPKELHWRTAYEAAKIAVDIVNESSDMFLPLKAVVGAILVLTKNYDVRFLQDSSDRALIVSCSNRPTKRTSLIREIEGRVQSLQKVLESPVGDRDDKEKARRDALRKSVTPPSIESGVSLNRSDYPQGVGQYD